MALSRLEVERFMVGGKSQKDAALYFGVTSRYIRKILASPSISSTTSSASSTTAAAPDAPVLMVDWVRLPGQRGLHRVAVTAHNQQEQEEQEEQIGLVPTGTSDHMAPVVVPAVHNAIAAATSVRVVRVPIESGGVDVFGWFLAASVGPVPLPALLVALLLIVLCGVR
jgi:hypothetical protein